MKEWDEDEMSPDELENDENLNVEPIDESTATPSEKYEKLLGEDSKKYKLSGMFKDWFLDYSSYVILQRAVPNIVDGLKPVQRRVLHAMFKMDDGNMTKVANIVGQAMQYHPHGDASILGALVQLGQKGFALDCQGNWGNILTGDSNAAARYIEARLSKFAKEVIFDPKITNWMTSYDGRNQEPTELPVRFPLLLAQGMPVTTAAIQELLLRQELLSRCQTYAFTVLGMAQLFHAVGMRDVETSLFRINHLENRLMILAILVGIGLQLVVTEIPYFVGLFGTCRLTVLEWVKLLVLAAMPMLAHELLVLLAYAKSKDGIKKR